MRILLFATAFQCSLGVANCGDPESAARMVERWEQEVNSIYKLREVRYSSFQSEYKKFFKSIPESRELLIACKNDSGHRLLILDVIFKNEMEEDVTKRNAATRFFPFFFCDTIGLDARTLMEIAPVDESTLGLLILMLFSDAEFDFSEVLEPPERMKFRRHLSEDPFDSSNGTQANQ